MRNMIIMKDFRDKGGTELALMSTSRSKEVALSFAASESPLIFNFKVRRQRHYLYYPTLACVEPRGGGQSHRCCQPADTLSKSK
mmetsp:Transcript_25900/g.81991  ORF Transcript_25900/g.81991 Transcript_25900/m.81991 type:complete len:84 (-) Transcript_25900:635-886(-)